MEEETQMPKKSKRKKGSKSTKKRSKKKIQDKLIYKKQFITLYETSSINFDIDADHIFQFDNELYLQCINYPSEMI